MSVIMEIGEVLKPQGIRGEIKVKPLTDDPSRFRMLKSVTVDGAFKRVESVRIADGAVYLKLAGIDSRNDAELFRGKFVSVERAAAVSLADGEFFIADLVGAELYSRADDCNTRLGTISRIDSFGAADVFTVEGEKPFSFAFVKALNAEYDSEKRALYVDKARLEEVAVYED